MDLESLGKLAGGGAIGAALAVLYMFKAKWIVPGYIHEQALERETRERVAREKAEARLLENMPALQKAHEAMVHSMNVATAAVETTAAVATTAKG